MTQRRVLSKITRGLYHAKSRSHQYFCAGNRREGWTVRAITMREDGSPDSSTGQDIAIGLSLFQAEQAIINHWFTSEKMVPRVQRAYEALSK